MGDIEVVRRHHLSVKDAKKIAQKTADDLSTEYGLDSEWEGERLVFRRSGIEGFMHVNARQIDLHVKVGFLLRPFKVKIEQHIERRMDELLASSRSAKSSVKPAGRGPARKSA
jgi:putative polyhydroxyalkanoate system protein